MLSVSRS